jgi:Ni/Fe-hydrogenase subunit HybB-like protein
VSSSPLTNAGVDWVLIRRRALVIGLFGVVACIVSALIQRQHFLRGFLVAWNLWAGISLGALALLMIQYLTGGAWGLLLRRILEASAANILLMAVLFLVLLIDLPAVYEWARPDAVSSSLALQHKAPYLNPNAFAVRAAIYFAFWIVLSWSLKAWSQKQDRTGPSPTIADRCRLLSGPGLAIYGATVTFAAIDWIMSLEPLWYSTIFPPLYAVGQILSGLAFSIAVLLALSRQAPLSKTLLPSQRRDLGNLLLAFVMLWAYLSFSQFLIIWSENLPEETTWYFNRTRGGWQWIAVALIIFEFAVPFLLLLSRDTKTSERRLMGVAALALAQRFVDVYWWVEAAYEGPMSF